MHYDGQPMQSAVAAEILDCRGYTFAKTRNPGNDGGGGGSQGGPPPYVGPNRRSRASGPLPA